MPEVPAIEAAFAAVHARLIAVLDDLTVERNRDSEVGEEECAEFGDRALLLMEDGEVDPGGGAPGESGAFGLTLYRCAFLVAGYISAETEAQLAAAIALHHARVVRALVCNGGDVPLPVPLGDGQTDIEVVEVSLARTRASVTESAHPFASFVAGFRFDLRVREGVPFISIP